MKKTVVDIFNILSKEEKGKFIKLLVLDIIISVLDIGFLILLLLVINFYTRTDSQKILDKYNGIKKELEAEMEKWEMATMEFEN